jgi:putative hydrolase of HD superfamily
MPNPRDLEFLYELGSMRHVQRAWRQHLATDCANDLEHTLRVIWIALCIARREGVGDEAKIMKMALTHDIAETRVSDLSHLQKKYVKTDEPLAVHELFAQTRFEDFEAIVEEYQRRECIEAKIVKDADNLDIDIELKELEERGHAIPQKWKDPRRFVRENKLQTQAAKDLWDEIQKSDPSSWYLQTARSWLEMPQGGK